MTKSKIYCAGLALAALSWMAFKKDTPQTKIYLIGDSTIADKANNKYPETGWGMPFRYFFDSTIVVQNRAVNGRSTKSFLNEGRWQPILDSLDAGDYVLIQFGHNDESKAKQERYTPLEEFKANLEKYISETRNKGAIPILLSPVARRLVDTTTHAIVESHSAYSAAVRDVAATNNVAFIDLDAESLKLLNEMGEENSKLLFLHLAPGEHPNYPEGLKDNTHFNELGARKMAQIVLAELRKLHTGLEKHIVKP